jgi:hypothetical protein
MASAGKRFAGWLTVAGLMVTIAERSIDVLLLITIDSTYLW